MFLLRICLLLSLGSFMATYPMKHKAKSAHKPDFEPADYPDLTDGLTDAEVESTLNGLSLDDLNALNKLLDDANNEPIELEASLRGHHRQAKKQQHYEDLENADDEFESALNSGKHSGSNGCNDDDDTDKDIDKDFCTERTKCHKKPVCTTKRCSTKKYTTACGNMDDFMDIRPSNNKKVKYSRYEECDPEDAMCLQRNHERSRQRSNYQDFSDSAQNEEQNRIESLNRLSAEARSDQFFNHKKELDGWHGKDMRSSGFYNIDYKVPNIHASENFNDNKEMPNFDQHWSHSKVAQDEYQPLAQHDELERSFVAQQQDERADEDKQQLAAEEMESAFHDDNMQFNNAVPLDKASDEFEAPLADNMEDNDGDSFIAKNARDPQRYVIQTDNGFIKSENEPGEHRLRTDKQQSEMLNYDFDQLSSNINSAEDQLDQNYKRFKRANEKNTDDAPENAHESYLKKLMDSFPRDQGSQSNLKVSIREANRAHLRVKRS